MLSDKWIHSTIRDMQVSDSIRYREAVTRLKRLLYDTHYKIEPSTMKSQNERRNYAQKLTESFEKDEEKDLSQDLETSTSSGILAMVKQQDELITQLEKENIFLKAEMVSTLEASKEIALQNEEFRRRLTSTLAQMEASQDFSLPSDGQEKVQEIMNCLKEEREHLLEGLKLQEETIATLRKRETEAIDKVKQAVELAEDSHKISEKVKDCSESSQAELQTQAQILHGRLLAAQKQLQRARDREKENEKIILDQERRLSALEEEKKELGMETSKKEIELAKKVRDLDLKVKDIEGDKHRLEKLLRDQKNTSESTLRRLEALLDRRNLEAESFVARRSSLEKQIRDAKDENQRLIEAVNELAKDRGHRTDDDKSAKQIPHIPLETREELNDIKATVRNHQDSIASLQQAVSTVRDEMNRGMDDLRLNLEEVCSAIKEDKSEANLQSYDSDSHIGDPKSIEMSIEQPPPQSNRSEGYGSLRGQTPPPTMLVERKAKTELIESSIPSSSYDHSFSKIIVPLPRKVKHGGVFPKIKEQDVESKDVDESEFNEADEEEITKREEQLEILDKQISRRNNNRIFEDIDEKPEVDQDDHDVSSATGNHLNETDAKFREIQSIENQGLIKGVNNEQEKEGNEKIVSNNRQNDEFENMNFNDRPTNLQVVEDSDVCDGITESKEYVSKTTDDGTLTPQERMMEEGTENKDILTEKVEEMKEKQTEAYFQEAEKVLEIRETVAEPPSIPEPEKLADEIVEKTVADTEFKEDSKPRLEEKVLMAQETIVTEKTVADTEFKEDRKPRLEEKILMAQETIVTEETVVQDETVDPNERVIGLTAECVSADERIEAAKSTETAEMKATADTEVPEKVTEINASDEAIKNQSEVETKTAKESAAADKDITDEEDKITEEEKATEEGKAAADNKTSDEMIVKAKTILLEETVATEQIVTSEDMQAENAPTEAETAELLEEK